MNYKPLFEAWGVSRTNSKLLLRVMYWHTKKQIEKGGHKWSVLTREQWAEQANITVDQYSRSLTVLKKIGLLVSERGRYKTFRVAYVRLTDRAEEDLIAYRDALNFMSPKQVSELLKTGFGPPQKLKTANCE